MISVSFADLSHTAVAIEANNNPLAVGYIAAYARTHLGEAIDFRLFKYPASLSAYLKTTTPTIACFSNYMWNERLSCLFAREIKRYHPQTVVVMGGPNYPVDVPEQQRYLEHHPEIDFFVDGEGEVPFVELFRMLEEVNFDAHRLRESGRRIPSVHYVIGGQFIRGDQLPRNLDLDGTLPSPYTMGLLDEFFDERLTPMLQTSRGCPYSCTFCHDGIAYMNKTRAFSTERVQEELQYIEHRVKTPTLQLADLNWGMFPADLVIAKFIADTRHRTGWPRNVMVSTAKNQKDRMVEMSRIMGDALQVGASVQSTDPDVLRYIKRSNLSLDAIVKMAKGATASGTGSFTEIILGLPGDTREKHFKSVFDMLDAGIQDTRLFQFILLPGTEANDVVSRQQFHYRTGFRVLARCFGRYDVYGEDREVAEVQEICRGTNTMPDEDYAECRAFDLTISIFNNGGVVKEFLRLAETFDIKRSTVLSRIHRMVRATDRPLAGLYDELQMAESENFFPRREDLDAFLAREATMDAYLQGQYGINHIYRARSKALLQFFEAIARCASSAVANELQDRGIMDSTLQIYIDELLAVSIARKSQLTEVDRAIDLTLHFDFRQLHRADYLADPRHAFIPEGRRFTIAHSNEQRVNLRKYFAQYGMSIDGIGQFLQRNDSHLSVVLYRQVEYADRFAPLDSVRASNTHFEPVQANGCSIGA